MECSQFDLPLNLFPKHDDPPRSQGIHLTQILRDMVKREQSWDEKSFMLAAEIGFMWEEVLSTCMKARLPERIGEIEKDGILMSPDGLDLEAWELWEYKATWRSSRNLPYDNWQWMAQVKAYAHALQLNTVRMAILYIMGDYKHSGPQYLGYRLTFTDYELVENWDLVLTHARRKGWIA